MSSDAALTSPLGPAWIGWVRRVGSGPGSWRRDSRSVAVVFCLASAVSFVAVSPGVGDLWAAMAREYAARQGVGLDYWFGWFAGAVPGDYSVVEPWLSRFVAVPTLGAVATVVVVLVCRTLTGASRNATLTVWLASITSAANLWCGRVPFAMGAAVAVVAVWAVQRRRRITGAGAGFLAVLVSPVAGAFLLIGLAGVVLHDRSRRRVAGLSAAAACVALALIASYFGSPGQDVFSLPNALNCLASLLLLLGARPQPLVRSAVLLSIALWPIITFVSNGLGNNYTRWAWLCLPVAVAATAGARPIITGICCVGAALSGVANTVQDLGTAASPASQLSYYTGLIGHLERMPAITSYRLEIVPDGTHAAAYALLPYAQLARGYETQSDQRLDAAINVAHLGTNTYRRWLVANAVGWVLLNRHPLTRTGEGALIDEHRPSYLQPTWSDANWLLLRVTDPTPIISAPAHVVDPDQASLALRVPRAGTYDLRIHWSPHLDADHGAVLRPGDHGWTTLRAASAGPVLITG